MKEFFIRQATSLDSEFIAQCLFTAFLIDLDGFQENERDSYISSMAEICRREDTFYSWRNTVIAEYDGKRAGAMIAYDAKTYAEMRIATLPRLAKFMKPIWGENFEMMDDEAGEGEYYLDTLAVVPEFRHQGIATQLLKYSINIAKELNLTPTLAVDPENPEAMKLYGTLGFSEQKRMVIFGEEYIMMRL